MTKAQELQHALSHHVAGGGVRSKNGFGMPQKACHKYMTFAGNTAFLSKHTVPLTEKSWGS